MFFVFGPLWFVILVIVLFLGNETGLGWIVKWLFIGLMIGVLLIVALFVFAPDPSPPPTEEEVYKQQLEDWKRHEIGIEESDKELQRIVKLKNKQAEEMRIWREERQKKKQNAKTGQPTTGRKQQDFSGRNMIRSLRGGFAPLHRDTKIVQTDEEKAIAKRLRAKRLRENAKQKKIEADKKEDIKKQKRLMKIKADLEKQKKELMKAMASGSFPPISNKS